MPSAYKGGFTPDTKHHLQRREGSHQRLHIKPLVGDCSHQDNASRMSSKASGPLEEIQISSDHSEDSITSPDLCFQEVVSPLKLKKGVRILHTARKRFCPARKVWYVEQPKRMKK